MGGSREGKGLDQDPTRVQVLCVLLQQCHHDPAKTPLQCHCNVISCRNYNDVIPIY